MTGRARGTARSGDRTITDPIAGIRTPHLVVHDVRRRLERSWPDTVLREHHRHTPGAGHQTPQTEPDTTESAFDAGPPAWPHAFPLGQPDATMLAAHFGDVVGLVRDWREWADRHGMTLRWRIRRVHGTEQHLPTHLLVDDIDTAARITGWHDTLATARARARILLRRNPLPRSPAAVLRQVIDYDEVDFDLLSRAADWFAERAVTGPPAPLTPRQVPIEGLHAKWLNTRHALLRELAGVDELHLLPPHPPRLHLTYLDPAHLGSGGRRHDCATVGDNLPLPYPPVVIIISENKDTAVHFPPLTGGIAVEGSGRGGTTAASFTWITDAPAVFYWGDIDPDGFEILAGFRAAGIPARSLLMNRAAYQRWERYGTSVDRHGKPLQPRTPSPTPHLTAEERSLYEDLCSPQWTRHRRIEQERIPLHTALQSVRTALGTSVR
ncbi:DUF2220 family protein [Saccharothrix sp. S26]|uniref:DUF3322 and DUF2220 domain-containing protein n=1 Tax=Saccharothrix sp. S26 TaxID=2907215 RepID=UPI001F2D0857|nr:DUF3322 and DUF2220 domain-containing protein [Saccharothrix sp. S26]MCE6995415.1 DUF2220 family protein [Saccharothrix sp. S26]